MQRWAFAAHPAAVSSMAFGEPHERLERLAPACANRCSLEAWHSLEDALIMQESGCHPAGPVVDDIDARRYDSARILALELRLIDAAIMQAGPQAPGSGR